MRSVLTLLSGCLMLAGCAMSPAEKANFGDPRELFALIEGGQIQDLNERLPSSNVNSQVKLTPLCAILGGGIRSEHMLDYMLTKDVDVNKICQVGYGHTSLALDYVVMEIKARGFPDPPYRANPVYRPSDLPILYSMAQKLIDKGAKRKEGLPDTVAGIRAEFAQELKAHMQNVADQQKTYNETVATNQRILGGASALAGVVVGAKILGSDSTAGGIARNALTAMANESSPPTPSAPSPAPPSSTTRPSQGQIAPVQKNDWRACGPQAKCLIGNGFEFCSGPYEPKKPMCRSGCAMDNLAFYHDTTLPPGAHLPGNYKCEKGSCNVVNSCN